MTHRKDLSDEAKRNARTYDIAYNAAHREQQRAWREANRDHLREKAREYRARNRERLAAYGREYKLRMTPEQKAALVAWRKEYEAKNRERIAARKAAQRRASGYFQRYAKNNRERLRAHAHNYRARRRSAAGALSRDVVSRLMHLQRGRCAGCGALLKKVGRHLDHIVPLARGGANSDDNVQLLCPRCNCGKRHADPLQWAARLGRLL